MQLTNNFELWEFERSQIASRNDIDNSVNDDEILKNIQYLCEKILQPVRNYFGKVVNINSGYRCEELERYLTIKSFNRWKNWREKYNLSNSWIDYFKVKSHPKGEAADIEIFGLPNQKLFEYIRDNFVYDQVILEYHDIKKPQSGWVHVSIKRHGKNRNESLIVN